MHTVNGDVMVTHVASDITHGLLSDRPEPDAQVGSHHVREAEAGQRTILVDAHLVGKTKVSFITVYHRGYNVGAGYTN